MRPYSLVFSVLIGSAAFATFATSGCGGTKNGSGFGGSSSGTASGSSGGSSGGSGGSGGSNSGSGSGSSGGSSGSFGTSTGSSSGGVVSGDGGIPCPPGLMCNVSCTGGGSTTVSGKVYDPAGKNPLYNIAVYVPATPLQALPQGVPTGADACNCSALYKSGALTSAVTGVDGSFSLTNVPVGSAVPLVLQVGKWRRSLTINVAQCQDNPQPDKSLTLPGTVAAGSNDSMPQIAVSTGSADSLECLMLRIGVPASEYVAGPGGNGHIHVFSGGNPSGGRGGGGVGRPEAHPMPGAPESDTNLWDSQDHLMPYDITLLSCEGGETFNANPPVLEQYLNAGGRAFASHFHYAWFHGADDTKSTQNYTAPADWGDNLASWTPGSNSTGTGGGGMCGGNPLDGVIDQTLNGYNMPFAKGVALQQWLMGVGALGQSGVPDLAIFQPRFNAVVSAANKPSQPWITSTYPDPTTGMNTNETMYFSFDTPVNLNPPPPGPDPGGGPVYCGRAVFSDLHVAGAPVGGSGTACEDSSPPPGGCAMVDLSPQEKALEFMLFDLSSCVIPDTVTPPVTVPPPPQ